MSKYASAITMTVGDLRPVLVQHILEEDTNAVVDLSGAASVAFNMYPRNPDGSLGTAKIASAAGSIDDGANGKVSYTWASGDTDTAGRYVGYFVITWSSGIVETVSALEITIKPAGMRMTH